MNNIPTMLINASTIGHRLIALRNQLGFTQSKMALRIDTSQSAYNTYENGKREVPVTVLINAAKIGECDLHWLITGEPTRNHNLEKYDLAILTVKSELEKRGSSIPMPKLLQISRQAYENAMLKNSNLTDEISKILDIVIM